MKKVWCFQKHTYLCSAINKQQKTKHMTQTLRTYGNGKYSEMFKVADSKTTEQLQDSVLLMEAMQMSPELSLSKAIVCEVLIERGFEFWLDAIWGVA